MRAPSLSLLVLIADLAVALARGANAATTVAGSVHLAADAGSSSSPPAASAA